MSHMEPNALRLRDAEPGDCRRQWVLANDPVVRAVSFSQRPIPWASHVEWFNQALKHQDRWIFVAEDSDGEFVGQIRFDIEGDAAVVSVAVDPSQRGRGLGVELIRAGTKMCLERLPAVNLIRAFIKKTNDASITAFSKAGYHDVGETTIAGHEAHEMAFVRDMKE